MKYLITILTIAFTITCYGTTQSNPQVEIMQMLLSEGNFNPETGNVEWKGKTFNVGNSRAFASRFSRYLGQSETYTVQQKEYWDLIKEIKTILSPTNLSTNKNVRAEELNKAYQLLYKAAEYPQDGGASRILAHMLYNTAQLKNELNVSSYQITKAEKERLERERIAAYNAYASQRNFEDSIVKANRERSPSGPSIPLPTQLPGSALNAQDLKEATEAGAKSASFQSSHVVKETFALYQAQSQILQYISQRRFDHAIMASNFYREQFSGSAQELVVGQEVLNAIIPSANAGYSVTALEQLSQEAIHDTNVTMDSVIHNIANGNRMEAITRLQESFLLGEHLEAINKLPIEERQKLLNLNKNLQLSKDLAENKDYDALLKVINTLYSETGDPVFLSIQSKVRVATQLSNMKLMQSKVHLSNGNMMESERAMQEALELWPLNPQIISFGEDVSSLSDNIMQSTTEFDRLLRNEDFDAIYKNKDTLAVGLSQDSDRLARFKAIIESMTTLNAIVTQANTLANTGNKYAAWDLLLNAEQIHPSSSLVRESKAKLMLQIQPYILALTNAEHHSKIGNISASFSLYQKALDLYPLSDYVLQKQKELIPQLLNQTSILNFK